MERASGEPEPVVSYVSLSVRAEAVALHVGSLI
jgi:hypothetical protein